MSVTSAPCIGTIPVSPRTITGMLPTSALISEAEMCVEFFNSPLPKYFRARELLSGICPTTLSESSGKIIIAFPGI